MEKEQVSRVVATWRDQANYDLETASAMLRSRRWLYVLFCCQQAVEKSLKALVVARTDKHPPPLHNLMRLAEAAELVPDVDRADQLRVLTAYYIETRYPEAVEALAKSVDRKLAAEVLDTTREVIAWLESLHAS